MLVKVLRPYGKHRKAGEVFDASHMPRRNVLALIAAKRLCEVFAPVEAPASVEDAPKRGPASGEAAPKRGPGRPRKEQ